MKCPVCPETNLIMSERQGVEIDYCPSCRGVWLDRGELDKIIERSSASENVATAISHPQPRHYQQPERYHDRQYTNDHSQYREHGHRYHHKKKKSLLSEIFAFD